jgi:PKD repeat protein
LTVTFTAQVAPVSTNVPIVSYEWDFDGDGTADALTDGPTCSHVYGEEGAFVARVSVLDAAGVGSQAECTVTVAESGTPPVCSPALEFFPHTGFSPLAVDLCVLGAGACGFREIAWDFDGDGLVDEITGSSSNAHLYAEPGKYWPTASVVFDDGAAIVCPTCCKCPKVRPQGLDLATQDGQVVSGSALALHATTARAT